MLKESTKTRPPCQIHRMSQKIDRASSPDPKIIDRKFKENYIPPCFVSFRSFLFQGYCFPGYFGSPEIRKIWKISLIPPTKTIVIGVICTNWTRKRTGAPPPEKVSFKNKDGPQMPPDLRLSHLRKRHWSSPRRDRSSPDPLGSAPPTRNAPKREENGRFHTEFLGKIVESWRLWKNICQWIGLRENLQETMVFTIKYRGFL